MTSVLGNSVTVDKKTGKLKRKRSFRAGRSRRTEEAKAAKLEAKWKEKGK